MPTPRISKEELGRAWEIFVRHEHRAYLALDDFNDYRESIGKSRLNDSSFRHHIIRAKEAGLHLSEGARQQVTQAGLSGSEARGRWTHAYDSEGKKTGTTRWAVPEFGVQEETLDRIKAAFSDITPLQRVATPTATVEDLLSVLPLFDVHWNMRAFGEETGGADHNIKLAEDDLMRSLETLLEDAPRSDTCLIVLGGDFLHSNGAEPFTGSRKHPLDVDRSQYEAIDTGITIIKYAVNRCLEHYKNVKVQVLRGNHDPDSHLTIAFALREWLATNDRAEVLMSPRDMRMMQWGRTALFSQHGDKMKPEQLALNLADTCTFWSECPHRYAYTGHKHQMAAARYGGLQWERLEPFSPADSYGASWVNRRAMKIDTYHKVRGRIGTVIDPIERAA